MTKKIMITKLTEKVEGMTKKDASIVIDAIGEVITDALVAGDDITIPNVGKFSVKDTAARTARNPQNGDPIEVPASKKVSFKTSSVLKTNVKNA